MPHEMPQREEPKSQQEREYRQLKGFTPVEMFGSGEPASVEDYASQGKPGPEPGTWSQNNGTIAIVTSEGKIYVWIPKPDPKAPRQVSYAEAIKSLQEAGYREAMFYVPFSNEGA